MKWWSLSCCSAQQSAPSSTLTFIRYTWNPTLDVILSGWVRVYAPAWLQTESFWRILTLHPVPWEASNVTRVLWVMLYTASIVTYVSILNLPFRRVNTSSKITYSFTFWYSIKLFWWNMTSFVYFFGWKMKTFDN